MEYEKLTVDPKKGYFRVSELSKKQIEDLSSFQDYILSSHIGLFGGRKQLYFLKPRLNESLEHLFVVKAIEEYIRKELTPLIELYETRDADIVCEYYEGEKLAIEIETGKKLRKNNPRIEKKVKFLNKKYGKNWFFVVTDWKNKRIYKKYGRTYVRKEVPKVLKNQYFYLGSNYDVC